MTHQAPAQLPVDEIAKAVSGAVTSVLSKISTRDGSSDLDKSAFQVPHPKKRKGNKGK